MTGIIIKGVRISFVINSVSIMMGGLLGPVNTFLVTALQAPDKSDMRLHSLWIAQL